MKTLFLSLILAVSFSANAEVVKSTTWPEPVSPGSITHFSDAILANTYVTAVASLIGGAWLSQDVSISVGYQEEAQETFTINVLGEIVKTDITESQDGAITVVVTTKGGPFNADKGFFDEGFKKYTLVVEADKEADTGYSTEADLTEVEFGAK